ncbi:hypothetical protein C8R48DRAFT_776924 [Suillus tomentosus]|nr:hypothetical protein C8R48DRAFT_776924 [Suillus tomentosus]
MYGGNATSFSPQLLSFAAVVRENSKGGAFESVPDWTSVTDDDPRIKSHPRFDKTVDYLPPSSLDDLVIAAHQPPIPYLRYPAGPEPEEKGSSDLGKEKAEDPPIPIDTPAAPPTKYNLFVAGTKKRKAAEEDTDAVVAVAKTKLPSPSEEPVKKRKIASKTISKTELGSDEDIATPWKHSVRYHPRQCDKCAKLDIACLVLPDKKFGNMRLACANCDSMKIACAIDGVGFEIPSRLESTREACSRSQRRIVQQKEEIKLAPTNLVEPEPTAREILQGIQDLGRRLDLLAATERVDALEVRVDSMETNLLKRLDGLEQRLNESDARWKSLS